jgi:hypothetical protein
VAVSNVAVSTTVAAVRPALRREALVFTVTIRALQDVDHDARRHH